LWYYVSTLLELKVKLKVLRGHAIKAHRDIEVKLYSFLTSALEGGELSVSRPYQLYSTERTPLSIE
jgi:hypothetical protein